MMSIPSQKASTADLWGTVTLRPMKPSARTPFIASVRRSSGTGNGT